MKVAFRLLLTVLLTAAASQGAEAQRRAAAKSDPSTFRDCKTCPLMVTVPAGAFVMGSPETEPRRGEDEGPQRTVTFDRPFAIGRYEVTFAEWDACTAGGGCTHRPSDEGWGRGTRPVVSISWDDAQQYVRWLSATTGESYRLPTEAEWEYAARASTDVTGQTRPFWTGGTIGWKQANYDANFTYADGKMGIYRQQTMSIGSLPRNAFGLHEVHGNVFEWVEDCYRPDYREAPGDGSAVTAAACRVRILRGGAWNYYPWTMRSAARHATVGGVRMNNAGLRVARTIATSAELQPTSQGR